MLLSTIPPAIFQLLETKLEMMVANMISGNRLAVARMYSDDALLTDLKSFRVEGRQAIDRHWIKLPIFKEWQLQVLETGGDEDIPHQRLYSLARMELEGKEFVDEGYCFVLWKKQANGDYQIHVDIYQLLKFEAQN